MRDPNEGVLDPVEKHGVTEQKAFQIETSKKAFEILSSGIYSNKIFAIIRELSCNAADAHTAAGKDAVPFTIHLPNNFEPHFSVQDFGVGLTDDEVQEMYTTYFSSTKTESNDFIGALGLGSKSPFSYTNSFTVTSVHNGVQRFYSAFIDEDGTPNIAKMGEHETDESNGVTVQVPVESYHDMGRFKEEAKTALRWFDPLPDVVGVDSFDVSLPQYKQEGSNWGLRCWYHPRVNSYRLEESKARIVQGRIEYPIEHSSLEFLDDEKHLEQVISLPFDIRVSIGEVGVAASREVLSYDGVTVANIKQQLKKVHQEFAEQINQQIQHADTLWSASRLYNDYIESATVNHHQKDALRKLAEYGASGGAVCWNGQTVPRSFTVMFENDGIENLQVIGYDRPSTPTGRPQRQTAYRRFEIKPTSDAIFVLDDMKKGTVKRVSYVLGEKKTAPMAFVLRGGEQNPQELKTFLDKLGNPPLYKASELEEPPKAARRQRVSLRRYKGPASSMTAHWAEVTDHNFDDGGIYVLFNRYRVMNPNNPFELADQHELVFSLLNEANRLGYITETVYGVTKSDRAKVQEASNWHDFFDVLAERISNFSKSYQRMFKLLHDIEVTEHKTSIDQWITAFAHAYRTGVQDPHRFDTRFKDEDVGAYAFIVEQLGTIVDENSTFYQKVNQYLETKLELEQIKYYNKINNRDVERFKRFVSNARRILSKVQKDNEYEEVINLIGKTVDDNSHAQDDEQQTNETYNLVRDIEQKYPMIKYFGSCAQNQKQIADAINYITLIDEQEQ